MAEGEHRGAVALENVEQTAEMLHRVGDNAGALRLRHAIAVIRNDRRLIAHVGFEKPLALMNEALALLDQDGHRLSDTAIKLQSAIDALRADHPILDNEPFDPAMLAPVDQPNGS